MSYILDALKKSEQQRQRGAAPSLIATQVTTEAPRPPAMLFYGLAASVLLVVGVAIGIVRPWQAEAPAPQLVAVKPPEAVVPPRPLAPAPAAVEITIKTERPPPMPTPITQPAPSPATDAPKAPVAAPAAVAPAPVQSAANKALPTTPEKPAGARAPNVAPEPPLQAFADLPLEVQQAIPKLSVTFHMYSGNAGGRLVGINDRMLHEGDVVEPGLVLERITPDGMILAYKGYRFLRGPR